uniref:uncharacterized protein LOC122583320 n=1 Tax=Erigeron canadensis TaxID=72917 RepID=UPI001CB909D9|nr:uncharacterized protein LOC122583320 [Erigeron canadensis]
MKSEKGEILFLYLSISSEAVSAVLVKEHEGKQHPVYYVSKSSLNVETRYSHLEKLILALIMASTKLRHYFETHPIHIKTNYPIKSVLRKPELSGRLAKWSVKLSAFNITYEPRTTIKSQALADFVADFTNDLQPEADLEVKLLTEKCEKWILHTDGAANVRGIGLGIILKSPQGDMLPQSISCEFTATNNETEYEALIAGLELAKNMGIKCLQVYVDSLLLANNFNGSYTVRGEKLIAYLEIVKTLAKHFDSFSIEQVPRQENIDADALAYLGSSLNIPPDTKIPMIKIMNPAIETIQIKAVDEQVSEGSSSGDNSESWIEPIMKYLLEGIIPEQENHRAFKVKVSYFSIIQNRLYRKSLAGTYLRCLEKEEAQEVMREIHDGKCGNHSGARALRAKIVRTGYYWPTMNRDTKDYVKKCNGCQRHGNLYHQPAEPMYPIVSSWPFMKWGMDIVGPMPKAPCGRRFMLAMTDYFSKWIEAEAFAQVEETEVISFIKRNILTRFGVPAKIICDNGSQFIGRRTTGFCESYGIKMITSTPVHLQANGQAESSNKIIVKRTG